MLADEVDYVIGVDTHRDQHTLAVVVAPTGAVLAQTMVRATGRGYAQALRFAESRAGGVRAWSVEGAGHYLGVLYRSGRPPPGVVEGVGWGGHGGVGREGL